MEEEKRKSVFQTLTPDECLEGITILTGIGAPMEMKEFIFDRLTLAGAPPSKEFFDEVKKALIVLGAVRAFGFSKSAEELLDLHKKAESRCEQDSANRMLEQLISELQAVMRSADCSPKEEISKKN